jgi:hypothetical protein
MMDGITVLSQETVSALSLAIPLGALSLLLFIVSFWLTIKMFCDGEDGVAMLSIVATVAAGFLVVVCTIDAFDPPETTYKVTIDESVSFQEFQERYEIVEQDGLIYTIKEKKE